MRSRGEGPSQGSGNEFQEKVSHLCDHLHLLNDEVEVVPSCVGEEAGVEGQGDDGGVGHSILPREVLRPAISQLDKPAQTMVNLTRSKTSEVGSVSTSSTL